MRAELKMRAELADPEDAHVRKARLMVGYPCNVATKLHVYLGHEGDNGKYYYVTGNISALRPGRGRRSTCPEPQGDAVLFRGGDRDGPASG